MRSRTQATSIVRVRVRLDPIESLVEMRPLWSQCDWKQRRRKFDLATSRRVRISWSAIGWCHVLLVLVGWFNVCTPINAELTARHASLRSHPFRYAYHRTRYHRSHSFSSAWAVLGDPELEYTLKMLEADQLQAALLQFVEWTHEYAQSSDWIEDNTGRSSNDSNTVSGRPGNKYWHSGACVQSTWEPLRSRLRPPTQYEQFGAQAQNARRLADLLSTLLGANDPSSSASSSTSFDSTESANSSDLTLHRPFFWSLLQVHLQADPTLAAVGIVFHPSVQLPLTMHLPPPASDRSSAASSLLRRRRRRRRQLFLSLNDPPNSASASFSSNSTDSTGFAPYVLRLAGPATARTSSSRITPHRFPTTHGGSNDQHHHRRPDHDTDDNEDADGGSPPPFRFVDLARLPAPRPQVVPNRRFASSVSPSPSFSSGLSSSASSVITSASSSSTNQPPSTTGRTRANNAILDRQANQLRALRQNLSAGRAQSYDAQHDTYAYSSSWYTVHAQHAQQNPYWTKSTTGYWSMPYSDCTVASGWLLTYSVPFFGRLADRKPQFLGVVAISVDLQRVDLDQCSSADPLFGNTHKCDPITTQCVPVAGFGFRRGGYACQCRAGYFIPNFNRSLLNSPDAAVSFGSTSTAHRWPDYHYFNGSVLEHAFVSAYVGRSERHALFPQHFVCSPCASGCTHCDTDRHQCVFTYSNPVRTLLLCVQSFSIAVVLLLALLTFRLRRSKLIASSRWLLLQVLLLGALLLYSTVIVRSLESTPITCFVEPWLRELGFGCCYGAVVVKLYRIYAEFQTRKAHRVCVRDKDLLKYVAAIVAVIAGYMCAWSALLLDSVHGLASLTAGSQLAASHILSTGLTANGLQFVTCRVLSWDHVTQVGETAFLLTGVYLSHCIRNARTHVYREKWALGACVYVELLVSIVVYVLRSYVWSSVQPDVQLSLLFVRSHLTVSVVLALLFVPKLCVGGNCSSANSNSGGSAIGRSQRSRYGDRVPDAMRLHAAILSNGEVDIGHINLADMDPEDIRSELRRVYTQLQVIKNKTLRKDNPHISKRRGGRKSTHRRFSLQPFAHSRGNRSHAQDHEHEVTEVSRTPEESTASLEGPSVVYADGPSSVLSSK